MQERTLAVLTPGLHQLLVQHELPVQGRDVGRQHPLYGEMDGKDQSSEEDWMLYRVCQVVPLPSPPGRRHVEIST